MNKQPLFDQFVKEIWQCRDEKALGNFLTAILTQKELTEIPTRLEIVKLLKQGLTQREIAKRLGVGVATVTRGSKELIRGSFSESENNRQ